MKIYATTKDGNAVILKSWKSRKEFESSESWLDPKWINVISANDLENYEFATYPISIVLTEDKKISLAILYGVYSATCGTKK